MEKIKKKKIIIKTRETDKDIEVVIEDNGIGIAKENIKHIGEPFFSTKTKGIGLGLFISKKIVDRHNASMKIESQEGRGSIFIIRFPKK